MRPLHRRLVAFIVAVGTLWLSAPTHVLAVGDNVYDAIKGKGTVQQPQVPATGGGDGLFTSMVELVVALAIIIALIYLLIRFLSTRTNLRGGQAFQTLAAHSLTANRSVHVLAVGDKVYLLGVGENVTLLDTITDTDMIDQLLGASQNNQRQTGLQDLLGKLLTKPKARPQAEEIQVQDLPFDATLREKLNNLKEQRQQTVDDWREGKER
ncbi:MAG: flagellar biosynthetic protein FliO [Tumebacillaceae bacterium]